MWLEILLIVFFILCTAFFAASEIAVVTTRRTRIKQLMDEGSKNAHVLNKMRESPGRFLATIQIGVTLSGALASAIGGTIAVQVIKPALKTVPIAFFAASTDFFSIAIVVVIITYFTLVFGELIPKSLALSNPEAVSLFTAPTIERFYRLTQIVVRILTASTNLLLRPFGRKAFTERAYINEEELKLLIEEGREHCVFEP